MSYGKRLFLMPDNKDDFNYYLANLLVQPSEFDKLWMIHSGVNKEIRLRIDSVHFRPIDVNDDGTIVRQTGSNNRKNKNRGISNKGVPFTAGIPCPSASLDDVRSDIRYNRQPDFSSSLKSTASKRSSSRSMSVDKSVLISNETPPPDNRDLINVGEDEDEIEVEKDPDDHQQKKQRGGYKENAGRPFVHKINSFIGDPCNVIETIMEVDKHAKQCGGTLKHNSRDNTHYHGLCIQISVSCEKGSRCQYWNHGKFNYHSQNPILSSKFLASHNVEIAVNNKNIPKYEYRANLNQIVGATITSTLPKDAEKFLRLMGLNYRSSTYGSFIRKTVVHPVIQKAYNAEEKRIFEKYGDNELDITVDGVHSSVRDAQHTAVATGLTPSIGELASVKVSSKGRSAGREDPLIIESITHLVDDLKYKLKGGASDQSASGQEIIRKMLGVAYCDMWHIQKTLLKLLEKLLEQLIELLKKYMEKCVIILKLQGKKVNIESLSHALDILIEQFQTESEYDNLEGIFREKGIGIEKWKELALDQIKMKEFFTEHNIIKPEFTEEDIQKLKALNLKGHINSVRLSKLSLKSLIFILKSLNPTNVNSLIMDINENVPTVGFNSKQVTGEKRRLICKAIRSTCKIPEFWSVGILNTVDRDYAFQKAINKLKSERNDIVGVSEVHSDVKESGDTIDGKFITEVNKLWSAAACKKITPNVLSFNELRPPVLNAKQLDLTIQYILDKDIRGDLPLLKSKAVVKEKKEFCEKVLMSLNPLISFEIDLTKARTFILQRAVGGPSSFRNSFATASRLANNYYPNAPRTFKVWWIEKYLKNWGPHWKGIHKGCNFIWYGTCHLPNTPEGDLSAAGQIKLKSTSFDAQYPMLTQIFGLFVDAIVTDRTLEKKIYDAANNAHTGNIESFNHFLQRRISQTIGCSHEFYEKRAQMAMCDFNYQKEWKIYGEGVLRKNKHSQYLCRAQHGPDITIPALSVLNNVLGKEFSNDKTYKGWDEKQRLQLHNSREKRKSFIIKSSEGAKGKQIMAISTMISPPLKGEDNEDNNERDMKANYVEFCCRAPFPFDYRDTIILPKEQADSMAHIRHQAREFEAMKNKIISNNSVTINGVEQITVDEDDIINKEVIDYYRSNPNLNVDDDNADNYDIEDDSDSSVNSEEEKM